MSHRRDFLQAGFHIAGGILFTGCSLLRADPPAAGALLKRRLVTVGGKRIRTIDVHAHCIFPATLSSGSAPASTQSAQQVNPENLATRLRKMDEQGIDMQVLSINPTWYGMSRDAVGPFVQTQNEKLAEFCIANKERFTGLATVALQFPDLAAQQVAAGVKLGLRGVSIGGSVNGENLSAPQFNPFWAKAEEMGVLIFMHPQPVPQKRLEGNGALNNVINNPLETTIALSHLIFEGTLDRYPGLKLCAAHGGGYLPSYPERSDHGCTVIPEQCKGPTLKKRPSEYMRQLYFDSLVFSAEGLRHLAAEAGASQIMMGTDYPFPWTTTAVDHILTAPGFTNAQRRAMLGETAARLLMM
jgi:aminocarboxymuconate-semialdehyde decarboxylase